MTKEYTTYHRIEGAEEDIERVYGTVNDIIASETRGIAIKFPKSISLQCTKTQWSKICETLGLRERKPKFGVI